MKWIKIFISMVQFFTRIPIKSSIILEKKYFGRGLIFAPIVGFLIGCFLLALYWVLQFVFTPEMTAVFIIIGYIIITGGLHLDGLGDTFDGIFSNRPKDKILEIMRDSRVGTNAVLGIFGVLFINYGTLVSIPLDILPKAILLMPVAGRIGSLAGAGLFTYARVGEGLGKSFVDYCNKKEVAIGFILTLIVFFGVLKWNGVLLAIISLINAILVSKLFTKRIEGTTGDVLGAVCEINQSVFLVALFVLSKFDIGFISIF